MSAHFDSPLQSILSDLVPLAQTFGTHGLMLDWAALEAIRLHGCEPAFLGYKGFPNTLCVSVNEQVVHGVPNSIPFKDGDVVKLDLGLKLRNGQCDDGALTLIIGEGSKIAHKLVRITQEALELGCQMAKPGYTTNDIGRVIHMHAVKNGLHVVANYGGHGIGLSLHEPPFVPNYSMFPASTLQPGQRIAIEPMFGTKTGETFVADDKTVTLKKGIAAHFERTVVVPEYGWVTGESL